MLYFSIKKGQKKLLALPEKKNRWVLGGPFRRQMLQKELQLGIIQMNNRGDLSLSVRISLFVDSVLQTQFRPDILTNHVDWSPEINETMPNSKQITIVRDPIQQFISAFEYYHKSGKEFKQQIKNLNFEHMRTENRNSLLSTQKLSNYCARGGRN